LLFAQPLKHISKPDGNKSKFVGIIKWPAPEADDFTAICEPIVWQRGIFIISTLPLCTACYWNTFTFLYVDDIPYLTGNIHKGLNGLLQR
jgi:hypothetical protein